MINQKRKAEIEMQVSALAEKHGLKTPGFNLVRFLSTQEKFFVGEQDMDDDTTGILLVNKDEKIQHFNTNKVILTNAQLRYGPDYQARRRFIVAHEYAHSCLHMEGRTMFAHRDSKHKNDPEEEEADFFARCLLMPDQQVRTILQSLPKDAIIDDKIDLIARTFGVTKKKARQRLSEDLGVA